MTKVEHLQMILSFGGALTKLRWNLRLPEFLVSLALSRMQHRLVDATLEQLSRLSRLSGSGPAEGFVNMEFA